MDEKQEFMESWRRIIKHFLPELTEEEVTERLIDAYKARYGEEPTQELLDESVRAQLTNAEESNPIPEDLLRGYVPIPNRFRNAKRL